LALIPILIAYPANPGAREPIFVAMLLNLVGERRVMMDVEVSNVRERWTRW
jgi:hypothetical protein